jgi:hypothetical protein
MRSSQLERSTGKIFSPGTYKEDSVPFDSDRPGAMHRTVHVIYCKFCASLLTFLFFFSFEKAVETSDIDRCIWLLTILTKTPFPSRQTLLKGRVLIAYLIIFSNFVGFNFLRLFPMVVV